jgi:hypothetical protein
LTCIRQLNLPQIQRILQEFEKQSEIMDMKEEMMNDAIDDAMEDEGDEEERYLFPCQIVFILYMYLIPHRETVCDLPTNAVQPASEFFKVSVPALKEIWF